MFYKIVVPGSEPGTYSSCHGGAHTWTPGVTYGPVPVDPCRSGFHACRLEDLPMWITDGMVVFEVELTDVVEAHDKVVGSTATLGRCLGTITREGMAEFARRGSERAKGYAEKAERRRAVAADAADAAARAADYAATAHAASYAVAADAAAEAAAEAAGGFGARYAAGSADYAARAAAARSEREQQGRDILSLLG